MAPPSSTSASTPLTPPSSTAPSPWARSPPSPSASGSLLPSTSLLTGVPSTMRASTPPSIASPTAVSSWASAPAGSRRNLPPSAFHTRTAGAMTEECIEIYKRAWQDDVVSFHGRFYDFENISMDPKAVQKPYPPIIFGSTAKARRTPRRAALRRLLPRVHERLSGSPPLCPPSGRDSPGG